MRDRGRKEEERGGKSKEEGKNFFLREIIKKNGIRVGEFHRGKGNYLLGGCPLACWKIFFPGIFFVVVVIFATVGIIFRLYGD